MSVGPDTTFSAYENEEPMNPVAAALENPAAVGENPEEVNAFRSQFEDSAMSAMQEYWHAPESSSPANNGEHFGASDDQLDSRLAS